MSILQYWIGLRLQQKIDYQTLLTLPCPCLQPTAALRAWRCQQELMHEAPQVDNVVEACMLAGRQDRLDALLEQLEVCEKALQVSTLMIF